MLRRFVLKRLVRDQRGMTITFILLMMPVIIALLGLVIDGGMLFLTRQRLDAAVDAAALAAARKGYDEVIWADQGIVVFDQNQCTNAARDYFDKNYPSAPLTAFHVTVDPISQNKVTVYASLNAPVFFMKLFNFQARTISSQTQAGAK